MKIVSACLAGVKCKRDGESRPCQKVMELVRQGEAIPVCPEQLGGLTTPRDISEQKWNQVFTKNGNDVSVQFKKWAEEALNIALLANCTEAILKSKSPSCGCGKVFDWTFSWNLIYWDGLFTKLLKENNIKVITEKDV